MSNELKPASTEGSLDLKRQLADLTDRHIDLKNELAQLRAKVAEQASEHEALDYWSQGLKKMYEAQSVTVAEQAGEIERLKQKYAEFYKLSEAGAINMGKAMSAGIENEEKLEAERDALTLSLAEAQRDTAQQIREAVVNLGIGVDAHQSDFGSAIMMVLAVIDKLAALSATVVSSDSAAGAVLRRIYEIASRLLSEPPDGDTGPLVEICTLIESIGIEPEPERDYVAAYVPVRSVARVRRLPKLPSLQDWTGSVSPLRRISY